MSRSKEEISYNMSRIKGKDTSIEKILRQALYHEGYRYRKNVSSLPGTPDIVLTKYKIAIFCDGDYFHGYDYRKTEEELKTHKEYWLNKIQTNQKRDRRQDEELVQKGYIVLRFWEHEIRQHLDEVLEEIHLYVYKRMNEATHD